MLWHNRSIRHTFLLYSPNTQTPLTLLPIDLSRNLADLRELDAVLSSSFISITAKIHNHIHD